MLPRHIFFRLEHHYAAHPLRRPLGCRTATSIAAGLVSSNSRLTTNEWDLQTLFDNPNSTFPPSSRSLRPTGLFMNSRLNSPEDFQALAHATIRRAMAIVARISNARDGGPQELRNVVKNFDRLSDVLCRVIDMAELVRQTHPHPQWVDASNEAYEMLCSEMNVLNTHTGLYEVLRTVMNDKGMVADFSAEEHAVALIFLRDFERSGIDLPPLQREQFVSLSDEIISLGRQFLTLGTGPKGVVELSMPLLRKSILPGGRSVLHSLSTQSSPFNGKVQIHGGSWEARMLLRYCADEGVRRDVFVAGNVASNDSVETLEALLRARASVARLAGNESYAAMTLGDKMAKTPENVMHFLRALGHHHRPLALSEISELARQKAMRSSQSGSPQINAWDRDFYTLESLPGQSSISRHPSSLSIGTVFRGLSQLFSGLYGISLRVTDTAPGETWHPDVKKLEVLDEDAGVMGWIYADLFTRPGKHRGAAHYTVRCSRRVDRDDWIGDLPYGEAPGSLEYSPLMLSMDSDSDMGPRRVRGKEGLYQLPIAVLSCEFAKPIKTGATILQWHEIETLFHEMGHALHSMIGQTEYHNVAGTRCATDFVELPSILMEQFLASGAVQALLTGQPESAPTVPSRSRGALPAVDAHTQILLATLDQLYHSSSALDSSFSSTETLMSLHDTLGVIPSVPGTAWQASFGHLYGYGATYYSYLFDQAIASRVWARLFEADPLSRETGERYKNEVLRFGGGRDPWKMVGRLLGDPEIEIGDQKAMEEVGRWGIAHSISVSQ